MSKPWLRPWLWTHLTPQLFDSFISLVSELVLLIRFVVHCTLPGCVHHT